MSSVTPAGIPRMKLVASSTKSAFLILLLTGIVNRT
jgi:hypothetical protein